MIHKGVARTFFLYAYSIASGTPKTGDAANIIVYKAEDMGPATQVTDTITEIDPTNMPGWYRFTTTLNGNSAAISAVSTTSGVAVTLAGVYLNTGAIPAVDAGANGGIPIIGSAPLTNLDAAISSRMAASSYIAPDNASIAAIKSQTDKLSFVGTDVKATLDGEAVIVGSYATNQSPGEQIQGIGYTPTRAAKLDNLDASVSTRLAAASYVAPDNASIASIKSKTDAYLDATVSSRLAASDYVAPDNTSISAIKSRTDAYLDAAVSSRLASSAYVAPDNASITAIKAKTDKLTFNEDNYVYAVGVGGSDGTDWTNAEKQQIRYRLGIDGTTESPSTNTPHLGSSYADLDQLASHGDSAWATVSPAAIWSHDTRTITGGTVTTVNDKSGYRLSAQGVDDIWDEPRSGHTITGSFGYYLDAAISSRSTFNPNTDQVTVAINNDKTGYSLAPDQSSVIIGQVNNLGSTGLAAVAGAVWNASRDDHTETGTFGAVSEWAGGSSEGNDWTDAEKQQIRYRLGIDGTTETPSTNTPHLGSTYSTLDDLAAHVSTRLATSDYVPPDNASISAIKTKTDKLTFDTNNYVYSIATNASTDWTDTEREQIRYRLGIDGTTQSPGDNTPHLGATYPTLDSLGSLVSTRLAAADYTPPDNVSISAIKTKTDRLTFNADNYIYAVGVGGGGGTDWTDDEKKQIRYRLGVDGATQTPSTNVPHLGSTYSTLDDVGSLVASRLAAEDYVAPDNASILAIKDKTDKLQFNTENAVKSTLSGETVAVELTTQAIDTIIDNFWDEPTTEHTVSGSFGALVSTKLSKLSFNPDNYVYADIGESAGIGSILIDHNYGGTDNLRYVTPGGNGIANGIIKAYLKEDYEAGRISEGYVKGETMTASDGRWRKPLALDPNTYILVFYKPGEYGITAAEVTISRRESPPF